MYRVSITPRAKKELKHISHRHRVAIRDLIDELQQNPYIGKSLTRELTNRFSFRIGMFRIVYIINEEDETILILTVGHRSIVYS